MTRVKAGVEFPTENPVILKKVQDKANRRGWGMFLITTELSGGRLYAKKLLKTLNTAHPESHKMPYNSPSA
ncbi:hypothetical protein QUF75_14005 [Desulfococcaceae bacterium HSG7]|nr:hypothetical protein [Desulfococcaceae bacterium HSG7]